MTENLLPRYYELLREAHTWAEHVDEFDLDSAHPGDVELWNDLQADSLKAQISLLGYIVTNASELTAQLEASSAPIPIPLDPDDYEDDDDLEF